MNSTTRGKLRTKTGCLTCRQRRKKCDETLPVCDACSHAGRDCRWPAQSDLLDRRFASHHRSRYRKSSPESEGTVASPLYESSLPATEANGVRWLYEDKGCDLVLLSESAAAHRVISQTLEIALSSHFAEKYYNLLLLPRCHPEFRDGWIGEIQDLMAHHGCLYYSVLACAASHLHLIDESSQMLQQALLYYSHAVRQLSQLLSSESQLENHNGILMSIMLLYLHGCMGRGTYSDIPRHVNAAMRILTMRLLDRTLAINRTFDKLAVESVLYQMFLVITGLWSDPIGLHYDFDLAFWTRAEMLLERSMLFPGQSASLNSPVLGVPVSLFRLVLSLKQIYQSRIPGETTDLEEIRGEVEDLELMLLSNEEFDFFPATEESECQQTYYRDATYLYALIASAIFEKLTEEETSFGPPLAAPVTSWQVRRAIRVLQGHQNDDGWPRCYIGNWPVYTLGFLVSCPEDVEVVRADLQRRWDLTKFAQLARFRRDLELAWNMRNIGNEIVSDSMLFAGLVD